MVSPEEAPNTNATRSIAIDDNLELTDYGIGTGSLRGALPGLLRGEQGPADPDRHVGPDVGRLCVCLGAHLQPHDLGRQVGCRRLHCDGSSVLYGFPCFSVYRSEQLSSCSAYATSPSLPWPSPD